jgi:hypothetical protein
MTAKAFPSRGQDGLTGGLDSDIKTMGVLSTFAQVAEGTSVPSVLSAVIVDG